MPPFLANKDLFRRVGGVGCLQPAALAACITEEKLSPLFSRRAALFAVFLKTFKPTLSLTAWEHIRCRIMAEDARILAILHEADLSPPDRIPILTQPDIHDFGVSLPANVKEARSLLIHRRTTEPGYRQPDQHKRHAFRSKRFKEALCDADNWSFSKHEVAKAFSDILSRQKLPSPGVAQALLSHASVCFSKKYTPTVDSSIQE